MPKQIDELINKQIRRAEIAAQRAESAGLHNLKPVVTISRGMGSGARIIAGMLAQELGWSLWDKELLDVIAEDASVSQRVVEAFDERSYSDLEVLVQDILGDHEMGNFLYIKHLVTVLLAISKVGNVIILGRGANFILPHALNIRIDAPDSLRVMNMMTYENLAAEQATEKIKKSDKDRDAFLMKTFGKDRVSKCIYHLSLCTGIFSNEDAVRIIKTAIESRFNLPLI